MEQVEVKPLVVLLQDESAIKLAIPVVTGVLQDWLVNSEAVWESVLRFKYKLILAPR